MFQRKSAQKRSELPKQQPKTFSESRQTKIKLKMFKLKNKLIITAMVMFGIATFVSCKKDTIVPQVKNETVSVDKKSSITDIRYELDKIPLLDFKQDINLLLINPEDKDDEKINNYLYKLSLATRELIKDPQFNQVIIELATKSETQTANLLKLKDVAPKYYDIINQNLSKNGLSLQEIADNLTHKPVAPNPKYPETAEIEKYVPAIFIPNLDKIDASLQPIISPNLEVDCRKGESIEDNIVCWYYSKQGILEELILSEETSLLTSNPLFLLDNAVTTLKTEQKNTPFMMHEPKPLSNEELSNLNKSANGNTRSYSSYENDIKSSDYKYESWLGGKSEFAVTAYRIDPNGQTHLIYKKNNGIYTSWQLINKISSSDIGSIQYNWRYHASDWQPYSNPWTPTVTQYGVNMVYWNTFERDWNKSSKGLGTCSADDTTIYLAGRRKYTSEWYSWIPSTTHLHYTRFDWINSNWAHWNNSWKAWFRLWKVYI